MAKCKNCIHYEACLIYTDGVDIPGCGQFKDRSKFIEIPCSVGDIVHAALEKWNYPVSFEVMGEPVIPVHHSLVDTFIKISDFGKIVFPTYEEAEKKLEELHNAH